MVIAEGEIMQDKVLKWSEAGKMDDTKVTQSNGREDWKPQGQDKFRLDWDCYHGPIAQDSWAGHRRARVSASPLCTLGSSAFQSRQGRRNSPSGPETVSALKKHFILKGGTVLPLSNWLICPKCSKPPIFLKAVYRIRVQTTWPAES